MVVGPCSVHDTKAAKEYALKLRDIRDELKDDLCVYFTCLISIMLTLICIEYVGTQQI